MLVQMLIYSNNGSNWNAEYSLQGLQCHQYKLINLAMAHLYGLNVKSVPTDCCSKPL